MTILGIDPGLATCGWGVVAKVAGDFKHIKHGCIITRAGQKHHERLLQINQELLALIKKHKPDMIAVEELFFYKNVKTALKVGEARGVIFLTIAQTNLPVKEYTPLQVKQAVTSYGRADKQQIQKMMKVLLKLDKIPQPDDAADALAVAMTCLQTKSI
jgi:crossover junction endodeoxyribonuclease RuvC